MELEQTLEKEQEYQINKLMRKIEKLERETLTKQSTLEQVNRTLLCAMYKAIIFLCKATCKGLVGFTSNQSCEDFTAGFVCLKKDNILIMSYDALSHIRGLLVQSSYEREREEREERGNIFIDAG